MTASGPIGGRRDSAFFGRRKGHRLRPRQIDLLASLLPRLALDLGAPPPADLRAFFTPPVDEIRMEIGFGGGEYLVSEAEQYPQTGFIGIEPFVNGMAKALAAIAERDLKNIRLHHGDAVEAMAWLPDQAFTGIDLIYPDPWPKRRHWKRRFVQESRILEIARILRRSGEFRFVTDVPDYVAWTLSRMLRSPHFVWTAERAADWQRPWSGFDGTRYEAKAKREGRRPCYLVFRRI